MLGTICVVGGADGVPLGVAGVPGIEPQLASVVVRDGGQAGECVGLRQADRRCWRGRAFAARVVSLAAVIVAIRGRSSTLAVVETRGGAPAVIAALPLASWRASWVPPVGRVGTLTEPLMDETPAVDPSPASMVRVVEGKPGRVLGGKVARPCVDAARAKLFVVAKALSASGARRRGLHAAQRHTIGRHVPRGDGCQPRGDLDRSHIGTPAVFGRPVVEAARVRRAASLREHEAQAGIGNTIGRHVRERHELPP